MTGTARTSSAREEAPTPKRCLARGGRYKTWLSVVPVLLFVFFSFMGSGSYTPYLQLYYERRGLSGLQIGALTGIGPALAVAAPPLWGLLVDRIRRVRMVIAASVSVAAATFLCFTWAEEFTVLFALVVVFALFSTASGPLSTALILSEAERLESEYGKLRLWGSVGFAAGILGAGAFVGHWGVQAIFALYPAAVLVSLLPLYWTGDTTIGQEPTCLTQVWRSLRSKGVFAVLLLAFLWRVSSAAYYTFYTIFLDGMGAAPTLISIAWAIGLVGEVTVLRLSGRIVKSRGIRFLLMAGLLGSAFRWIAYALAPTPEWTLPFQLLHGLTFGACTTAAVLMVDNVFPPGLRATGQGILNTVMWGVGGLVGSLAAGALFQSVGVRSLFALSGLGAAMAAVLAWRLPPRPSLAGYR